MSEKEQAQQAQQQVLEKKKKSSKNVLKVADQDNNNQFLLDIPSNVAKKTLDGTSECPVELVTVFNDRAEVTRSLKINLDEGAHELVVTGLSTEMLRESVRVSGGKGNATILEVSVETDHGQNREKEAHNRIEQLLQEQLTLETQLSGLRSQESRLKKELQWLEGYATTANTSSPVAKDANSRDFLSEDALSKAGNFMQFYSEQLERIDKKSFEVNEQIKEMNKKIAAIEREIAEKRGSRSSAKLQVTITLVVQHKGELMLSLSYVILNAKWYASYDCRVSSASDNLQLVYYGLISNGTGEDWRDVEMVLSTATPSVGGAPPKLKTSRVNFKTYNYAIDSYSYGGGVEAFDQMEQVQSVSFAKKSMRRKESSALEFQRPASAPVQVLTTTAEQGGSNTTFRIPRKATILSDNKPHKVTITIISDLTPRFTYSTVPCKSLNAYLKATVENTTADYPFLEGNIQVFMDSNFVANSHMKHVSPKEEFALFLGTDSGVKVDYKPVKKVKESTGSFLSGKGEAEHYQHMIVIKNTKQTDVAVTVYDQLPLSSDEKIKVKLTEPNLKENYKAMEVKLNKHNNVEWRVTIEAGKKAELPFHYTIEWPQGKNIEIACDH